MASTASSIISSTAASSIVSSTNASTSTWSASNKTEYWYSGYTGSLAQYSGYCSDQYFAWLTTSEPGTYTTAKTRYQGFGPTDSQGVLTSVTIQSFYPTTWTYTENLPSDFPGHASPPCVRSKILAGCITRLTNSAFQCSRCTIVASTVDLFYWPPSASATGRLAASNSSNAIRSSVNEAGFTLLVSSQGGCPSILTASQLIS